MSNPAMSRMVAAMSMFNITLDILKIYYTNKYIFNLFLKEISQSWH